MKTLTRCKVSLTRVRKEFEVQADVVSITSDFIEDHLLHHLDVQLLAGADLVEPDIAKKANSLDQGVVISIRALVVELECGRSRCVEASVLRVVVCKSFKTFLNACHYFGNVGKDFFKRKADDGGHGVWL